MRNLLLVLMSAGLLSGCMAEALTSGHIAFSDGAAPGTVEMGAGERAQIHQYCVRRHLARSLSPQERRMVSQLYRDGRLPLRLGYHRLPLSLEDRLPPLPQPYVRVLVGTDVLVINRRTRVIADLARGVCPPSASASDFHY